MKVWFAAMGLAVLLPAVINAEEMPAMSDLEKRCHEEVVALHETIEAWLTGSVPDTDEDFLRFSAAMAEDFEIISPGGTHRTQGEIISSFRGAHGAVKGELQVEIRNPRTRLLAPPLALLTYEEWQIEPGRTTARLSTVLFREDATRPGGVAWVHLHETWLPGHAPAD